MNNVIKPSVVSATPYPEPEIPEDLIVLLRTLRAGKVAQKQIARRRQALTLAERQQVQAKTASRCHICGGRIEDRWQADHVLAHSGGGGSEVDNYLAAHTLCNNYRWDYLPEEFQAILKIGVWARTQIERSIP